ncbi:MAG: Flp pilus assembly complex ATPase component TadA [Phycisphaerales bacterium]|nr:Flp pilus assembly complex ATPase component TadA [Phycisphaerales bacterium]MCB9862465.1 Flp pilus assembly complex ATPase component TadA [Phycisphaerales bacterium]
MARKRQTLGEILVEQNVLTKADADKAAEYGLNNSKRLGEALMELDLAKEEDIYKALAKQHGMKFVDVTPSTISQEAVSMIDERLIKSHEILPMSNDNGVLTVIIGDPLDLDTIDMLRFRLSGLGATDVVPVVACPSRIKRYIDKVMRGPEASLDQLSKSLDASVDASLDQDVKDKADSADDADAPIIKLINMMISEAVRTRGSDIHVEPMSDRVRVRYRIDGVCLERESIPKRLQNAVTTRLKIMSGVDIAEKRIPQDGRIKLRIGGKDIDFRVSCCPGVHGESIVLRILRPDSASVGIQQLGFEEDDYEKFLGVIKKPNGIFLVTGPTGSGKTTTLYAALQELNRPDKKIITAEDPVEYVFPGMNQCQVREDIGLSFGKILRSMLRQAPNIILVGEIRDLEVGEIAIQAALTGHLVFSTLHTNDASSALTRLIDLGIKPFLVASSIQAIMAQRLIRRLCTECRKPNTNPDKTHLRVCGFKPEMLEGQTIYKPVGCSHCSNTGYRGRQGIFELLTMNSELRELAFNRAGIAEIRRAARATGMKSLLHDGQRKILRGITSLEELSRLAQAEVDVN